MLWNSSSKMFNCKVTVNISSKYIEREVIIQIIARIFGSLELLGLVICRTKLRMQQIWLLKCEWNDLIPYHVTQEWESHLQLQKHSRYLHAQLPKMQRLFLYTDLPTPVKGLTITHYLQTKYKLHNQSPGINLQQKSSCSTQCCA